MCELIDMVVSLLSPGTGERSRNSCNSLSLDRISGLGLVPALSSSAPDERGSPPILSSTSVDDISVVVVVVVVVSCSASWADQKAAATPLSEKYCDHDNLTHTTQRISSEALSISQATPTSVAVAIGQPC